MTAASLSASLLIRLGWGRGSSPGGETAAESGGGVRRGAVRVTVRPYRPSAVFTPLAAFLIFVGRSPYGAYSFVRYGEGRVRVVERQTRLA